MCATYTHQRRNNGIDNEKGNVIVLISDLSQAWSVLLFYFLGFAVVGMASDWHMQKGKGINAKDGSDSFWRPCRMTVLVVLAFRLLPVVSPKFRRPYSGVVANGSANACLPRRGRQGPRSYSGTEKASETDMIRFFD